MEADVHPIANIHAHPNKKPSSTLTKHPKLNQNPLQGAQQRKPKRPRATNHRLNGPKVMRCRLRSPREKKAAALKRKSLVKIYIPSFDFSCLMQDRLSPNSLSPAIKGPNEELAAKKGGIPGS